MQDEFYAIAFRKNVYDDLEQLQQDLDVWMEDYNTVRTHSGKYGYGKTPMQTFEEAKHLGMQKQLDPLETARSSLGKYTYGMPARFREPLQSQDHADPQFNVSTAQAAHPRL